MSPQPTLAPPQHPKPRIEKEYYESSIVDSELSLSDGELPEIVSDGEMVEYNRLLGKFVERIQKPAPPTKPPPQNKKPLEFSPKWELDMSDGELGDLDVSDGIRLQSFLHHPNDIFQPWSF